LEIIDAQVHCWATDSEDFPWNTELSSRLPPAVRTQFMERPVTAPELIAMMNAVGVDGALLTSPTVYGIDHSYAFAAAAAYPGRFGVVAPLYPSTPDVESRVFGFRDQPYAVGIRLVVLQSWDDEPLTAGGFGRIFGAAEQAGLPVCVSTPTRIPELAEVARRHPELTIVLDHLLLNLKTDVLPLTRLPDVLALSRFHNIVVKCTGVPRFTEEPYPFDDLWPIINRLIDAFGVERLLWGSDVTQHIHKHPYCELVDYIRRTDRLNETDKELLLGQNLRRILWPG
jgi:L-fuconolactonase